MFHNIPHDLYSSSGIVRIMKYKRFRWAWQVPRMGMEEKEFVQNFYWEISISKTKNEKGR
jgi:hypothetical protein